MASDSKSIRIPCNSRLKEYNTKHLMEIAAMSVNDVYTSLSSSGGIVTAKCAACEKLLSTLVDKVGKFGPSVPMTQEDQHKVAELKRIWLTHLQSELAAVSKPVKPTYLRDTVTQILHTKGYEGDCQNIHLEWFLAQHKSQTLVPDKIADAIIEHKGTNWSEVPHLVHNDYYYVRLQANHQLLQSPARGRGKYDDVLNVVEFIESFPSTSGIESLDARLHNDIEVVNEMLEWRESQVETYDYQMQLQLIIDRLQTLPSAAREITFAKIDDKTRKRLTNSQSAAKKVVKKTKKEKVDDSKTDGEIAPGETSLVQDRAPSAQPQEPSSEQLTLERQQIIYNNNHVELRSYLEAIAPHVSWLAENIREPRNVTYIEKFAHRPDFKEVFNTLKENTRDSSNVPAKNIMQFIRNVAIYNITEWGAPAPVQ